MVDSDIDRDLAVELARNVDGVVEVKSALSSEPAQARQLASAGDVSDVNNQLVVDAE